MLVRLDPLDESSEIRTNRRIPDCRLRTHSSHTAFCASRQGQIAIALTTPESARHWAVGRH